MRIRHVSFGVLFLSMMLGCSTNPGKPPALPINDRSRAALEGVLGPPTHKFSTLQGDVYRYKIKLDRSATSEDYARATGHLLMGTMPWMLPAFAATELGVLDNEDSYLVRFNEGSQIDSIERVSSASYYITKSPKTRIAFERICLLASFGNKEARDFIGRIYDPYFYKEWAEAGVVQPDNVLAYLWYDLAGLESLKQSKLSRMSDAEAAEVKTRAESFPNPYDCVFSKSGEQP